MTDDTTTPVMAVPYYRNPALNPSWRDRVGCTGLAMLLAVLLMGSFMLNGLLGLGLIGAVANKSDQLYEEKLVDGKAEAEEKLVIVSVQGLIMESMGHGPGTVSQVTAQLKKIREDKSVKGVLLYIDSPGGGVTASDRIYHEFKRFREETKLPIVSLFGDVSASGGYYIAMASDHVMCHRTSLTGSIGVISQFYNFSDAMHKLGLKVNTIKSLNAEGTQSFKDMGYPYRPMRPEEEALFQAIITDMWNRFTEVVAQGREGQLTLDEVRELADGRVYTGPMALEKKLVDSLGYREDAYAKLRELANAPDAKIVSYKKQPTLQDLFKLTSDPPALSTLLGPFTESSPRFLYLWSGH